MKVRKYRFCPFEIGFNGLHTSVCTNSGGMVVLQLTCFPKAFLCCLLRTQLSHISFGWWMLSKSFTIFLFSSCFRLSKLRCPYLRCHNKFLLLMIALRHLGVSCRIARGNILFFAIWTRVTTFPPVSVIVSCISLRLIV